MFEGIDRGLIVYGVGGTTANPELGITLENGETVLTIWESDGRLAGGWDSGYSDSSDMGAYPLPIASSGGDIVLLNDGWYTTFTERGYSMAGGRVVRTWKGAETTVALAMHVVQRVAVGIGLVSLSLGCMDNSLRSEMDSIGAGSYVDAPMGIQRAGEKKLFGGGTFYMATSFFDVLDIYGAPIGVEGGFVPSDRRKSGGLYFPPNSFFRIISGLGEGTVGRVGAWTSDDPNHIQDVGNLESMVFSSGMAYPLRLWFTTGIPYDGGEYFGREQAHDWEDISIIEFFVADTSFQVPSGVTVDSVGGAPYVQEGNKITVLNEGGSRYELQPVTGRNSVQSRITQEGETIEFPTWRPLLDMTSNREFLARLDWDGSFFTDVIRWKGYSWERFSSLANDRAWLYDASNGDNGWGQGVAVNGNEIQFDNYYPRGSIYARYIAMSHVLDQVNDRDIRVGFDIEIPGKASVVSAVMQVVAEWSRVDYDEESKWAGGLKEERVALFGERIGNAGAMPVLLPIVSDFSPTKFVCNNVFNGATPNGWSNETDERDHQMVMVDGERVVFNRGSNRVEVDIPQYNHRPSRVYINLQFFCYSESATAPTTIRVNQLGLLRERSSDGDDITVTTTAEGKTLESMIEQVALDQDWGSITPSVDVAPAPQSVRAWVMERDELKTDVALNRLLREAWQLGYMTRGGVIGLIPPKWRSINVAGLIGADSIVPATHRFVDRRGVRALDDMYVYDADNAPTGGVLKYDRQPDGSFAGEIVISRADAEEYDPAYVTGVSNPESASLLWTQARLVYQKTGVMRDIRDDQSELWWLYKEEDALEYLQKCFAWAGARDFMRDVIECRFAVASLDESTTGVLWNIGDPCRVFIPTITNTGDYSGVITGLEYNANNYSAIISVRVGQIREVVGSIRETGISDVNIIETGTAITNIIEVGIV